MLFFCTCNEFSVLYFFRFFLQITNVHEHAYMRTYAYYSDDFGLTKNSGYGRPTGMMRLRKSGASCT
jgi:hypothetical protein